MKLLLALLFCSAAHGAWIHPEVNQSILKPPALNYAVVDGKSRWTGYKPSMKQYEGARFKSFSGEKKLWQEDELPRSLNYLDQYKPPVNAQQCGDCWAQGARTAFEGIIGVWDKMSRDISVQAIIDCSGFGSCGGGQLSGGMFDEPKGAVYNSDYPYRGVTQRCKTSQLKFQEKARSTGYVRGDSGGSFKIIDIMRALYEHGPLETCGASSSLGGSDQDGFILRNRRGGVDHCWGTMGWIRGEDFGKPAGIYGVELNSWGEDWGKGGVVYVRWGQNDETFDGSLITEAAFIDYKDKLPPEPILFKVETSQVVLNVTILPVANNWNLADLTKALNNALKEVEAM